MPGMIGMLDETCNDIKRERWTPRMQLLAGMKRKSYESGTDSFFVVPLTALSICIIRENSNFRRGEYLCFVY